MTISELKYLPNIKPKITKTNTSKLKNSFVITVPMKCVDQLLEKYLNLIR